MEGARLLHMKVRDVIKLLEADGWYLAMKKYLIVIEPTRTGFSAFCPDLPGCVGTGKTKAAVIKSIRRAIDFHLDGMKDDGLRIPTPKSSSTYLEIEAA